MLRENVNPTSKFLTIKADTALGCVAFELIRNLSQLSNTITHFHQDIDGSNAMCSLKCQNVLFTSLWEKTLISLTFVSAIFYTIILHNHMTILPVPIA